MAVGLIGKKIGMTQVIETSKVTPVTLLEIGPCTIIRLKTKEKDGYQAVQVGYEDISAKKVLKPYKGQFPENIPPKRFLKEFRTQPEEDSYTPGDVLLVDMFKAGDKVDVRAKSKGRGFQGVMKRFNFAGGPKSHGSQFGRLPGSIGNKSYPGKIWKGKKLPGHMGNCQVCILNQRVVAIDTENNLVAVEGCVPGPNGGFVMITKSNRSVKKAE